MKVIIIFLLLATAPLALGPFYLTLLGEILIWGLFAGAFNLIYGYSGLLSLGQSAYFGLGAYAAALSIIHLEAGLWAVPLGAAIGMVAAWAIGTFAVRIKGHGFIIATAAVAIIFYLLALEMRWLTGGDDGLIVNFSLDFYHVLIFVGVAYLILDKIIKSPLGGAFKLVRENEARAGTIGYDTKRLKLISFVLAGAFSGLAGAIYSLFHQYVSAQILHWTVSADAIIWTLFGGVGTFWGPMVGAGILLLSKELLSGWWVYGYPILVGVLILVVIFAPRGIMGSFRR